MVYYNIFIILPNNDTDYLIYYHLFLRRKLTFMHKVEKVQWTDKGPLI